MTLTGSRVFSSRMVSPLSSSCSCLQAKSKLCTSGSQRLSVLAESIEGHANDFLQDMVLGCFGVDLC